jgi:hypothetical protein
MRIAITLALLTAPFAFVAAVVMLLVVVIGRDTAKP